ncbi:hypothetical protein N7454_006071 [Penicillium verhagenii]|nr:hypothetical protein N7454_006071 [Penicillium verhagenii]
MTIFYAHIQTFRDTNVLRYLITCANQETANEWWRAIQAQADKGTTGYKDVRRIATQMYLYDSNTLDLSNTTQVNQPLAYFAGRVFYTLLPNTGDGGYVRVSQLPPPQQRDPISGESCLTDGIRYFIRSKSTPHVYWVKSPTDDTIVASKNARTAFIVERADDERAGHQGNVSDVMIDDDDVYVILAYKQGSYVCNGSNNFLSLSGRGYSYKLRDFKNSFSSWDTTTSGTANWSEAGDSLDPSKCNARVMSGEISGYEWELV